MCQDGLFNRGDALGWHIESTQKCSCHLCRFEMMVVETIGNCRNIVQVASDNQCLHIHGTGIFSLLLHFDCEHFTIRYHTADIEETFFTKHSFSMLCYSLHDSCLHY